MDIFHVLFFFYFIFSTDYFDVVICFSVVHIVFTKLLHAILDAMWSDEHVPSMDELFVSSFCLISLDFFFPWALGSKLKLQENLFTISMVCKSEG